MQHCMAKPNIAQSRQVTTMPETSQCLSRTMGAPLAALGGKTGAGTAVIDAWVSKFDGTWTLTNTENETVRLKALLPAHPSQ